MITTYFPYAHHQKKVLIKQAAREFSQSLADARWLAINGLDTGSGNLNIWLYIGSWATQIDYYAYPHDVIYDPVVGFPIDSFLKSKMLPLGAQVDTIWWSAGESVFIFDAITGSGAIFPPKTSPIEIQLSYRGSTSPVLQRKVLYYPESYISDY